MIPVPCNPRTPLERIRQQLAAAHRQLLEDPPSRAHRRELVESIRMLEKQEKQLLQS